MPTGSASLTENGGQKMVDGCYDATFPKGVVSTIPFEPSSQLRMSELLRPLTYIENEVGIAGILTKDHPWAKEKLTLCVRGEERTYECVCPAYPTIKALGCPLHHEGLGGSWTVLRLQEELGIEAG